MILGQGFNHPEAQIMAGKLIFSTWIP